MHPYPGRPPKCWGGARRAQWLTSTVSVAALPPPQNPTCRDRPVGARAEGPTRPVWVGRLSGWVVSNLYETPRMAISVFLDPAPSLLLQDLAPAGGAASSRPRKTPRPAAMSWSVGGSRRHHRWRCGSACPGSGTGRPPTGDRAATGTGRFQTPTGPACAAARAGPRGVGDTRTAPAAPYGCKRTAPKRRRRKDDLWRRVGWPDGWSAEADWRMPGDVRLGEQKERSTDAAVGQHAAASTQRNC